MDQDRDETDSLPAVLERQPETPSIVGHEELERLRREVSAPDIVREAGPNAEYAYADFFKAKIPNGNTRKAYKRAVDRFLRWCREHGLQLRQVTSFLVGDYVENHLNDRV
jgi:integrase/recombinase XerD